MGRTIVNATIIGPRETRTYQFLVDTGATFIGLPIEEIEALGLTPVPNGRIMVNTAEGLVERSIYIGVGELEGQGFNKEVIAMPIPVIGYEALESLRFRVNPVTERIERVPDTEVHPPLALWVRPYLDMPTGDISNSWSLCWAENYYLSSPCPIWSLRKC